MELSNVKLLLCPRNWMGHVGVSHTGLAVSAQNTARVLRSNGINATVRPVIDRKDIERLIAAENPTHLVINALWLPAPDLTNLVQTYAHLQWAVLCHSNIAFLQAEPNGILLLREAVDLELSSVGNFQVAANSTNGSAGVQDAWECPCLYLPNLYYLDETVRILRRHWSGGTLRIGAFGALRPLKNPTASAFAALAIAHALGTDLQFYINTGRNDGGWSNRLLPSIEAIYQGLPHAKLVKVPWAPWTSFRRMVRGMHLMLQPSFTESFNVVTADGVAEGIASVVSDVIEWAPRHWQAHPDNTEDIARVGRHLLNDTHSAQDGLRALTNHNADGVRRWSAWLQSKIV